MIYGYSRVSTEAQDRATELADLKAAGCAKVFQEKLTDANAERPQLRRLMAALDPGDLVMITAVGRLAHDPMDLLVLARDTTHAAAALRSLDEAAFDTSSEDAEIILLALGVAAKLHRKRILENTEQGWVHANPNGLEFGRQPKLTPHRQREAVARIAAGEPQGSGARSYNVSHSTIARIPALEAAYG